MTAPLDLVTAALAYAARKLRVLQVFGITDGRCDCGASCPTPGKHPAPTCPNGCHSATMDESTIRRWWRRYPNGSVAIATGSASGLVVIDQDNPAGGAVSLEILEEIHGPLPYSRRVRTPNGIHVYTAHPGAGIYIASARGIAAGIDLRADGAYVVAPPSTHISGQQYVWLDDEISHLEACPAWIVDGWRSSPVSPDTIATPELELEPDAARALVEETRLPVALERIATATADPLVGTSRHNVALTFGWGARADRVPRHVALSYTDHLLTASARSSRTRRLSVPEVRAAISSAWKKAPDPPSRVAEQLLLRRIATGRPFAGPERPAVLRLVAQLAVLHHPRHPLAHVSTAQRLALAPPFSPPEVEAAVLEAAQRVAAIQRERDRRQA
jgi:hypothetical protein